MADLNKFEKMLELLVNENKEAAQELFHEIVVEKSRDIYESLLEDEDDVEEATDEEVDESDEDLDEADDEAVDESDEDLDENFSLDSFEVEGDDDMGPMDQTGDLANDLGMNMDDEGEEEGEEGDMEDRVEDLEDALDDLKAEFEKMMAGDDEGDDMDDMGDDEGEEEPEEAFAFESADEEDDDDEEVEESADEEVEEAEEETEESAKSASETMREYVEKVSATMGDNGANNKSTVANPNNMGGTAGNLNQAATASDPEAGAGGSVKGNALSDTSAKDMNTKNVNVPGGKAAKAGKTEPGHGAEKKGKPETADNKKSTVGK